jgi:hypothetical protein
MQRDVMQPVELGALGYAYLQIDLLRIADERLYDRSAER